MAHTWNRGSWTHGGEHQLCYSHELIAVLSNNNNNKVDDKLYYMFMLRLLKKQETRNVRYTIIHLYSYNTLLTQGKDGIPAVDPDSSQNTYLSPLLFSHPTPTPTTESTLLHSLVLLLLHNLVPLPILSLLISSSLLQHLTSSAYSTHHPYFDI